VNLHSLMVALDDYRFKYRREPESLRMTAVLYGWYHDRMVERRENYFPMMFNGIEVMLDRDLEDGFTFESKSSPSLSSIRPLADAGTKSGPAERNEALALKSSTPPQ
jgi:hypothetical protein